MKNKFIRMTFAAFLAHASGIMALAENQSGRLELKLDDCVKIALQKNPQVRAAIEGIKSSQAAIGEARAPYYPELKATAGYSRWQTRAFLPEGLLPPTAPKVIGPTDDYKAQGTARWILFDNGERKARLDISKVMAKISVENLDSTRQNVVFLIHERFYSLAASIELKQVAVQNQARAEQHLKFANERKSAGAVPESDVLRARVAASEAKLNLVRANNLIRINMGWLNTVMGLPVETDITLKINTDVPSIPTEASASSLITQAIMCRPEIKASQGRIEAAQKSLAMAKSEYGPKVRAEGAYGLRDDASDLEEKEYAAGVSIELPIFSGFSTKYKISERKAELSKTESETEAIVQAIQQEVWIARSQLQEANETVETADIRVKDATESTRMGEERYKNGGCTITDLMDIQTALAKAEADLVEAKWNLRIAKANLVKSTGTLIARHE